MNDLPNGWVSATEKMRRDVPEKSDLPVEENTGPDYLNNEGDRYLIGDTDEAYLIMQDAPENTC